MLIFIAIEFISVNYAFLQEVVEEIVPNNHVPPCPPGNTVFDRMCIDYSSRTGDASSVSPGRLTLSIFARGDTDEARFDAEPCRAFLHPVH